METNSSQLDLRIFVQVRILVSTVAYSTVGNSNIYQEITSNIIFLGWKYPSLFLNDYVCFFSFNHAW